MLPRVSTIFHLQLFDEMNAKIFISSGRSISRRKVQPSVWCDIDLYASCYSLNELGRLATDRETYCYCSVIMQRNENIVVSCKGGSFYPVYLKVSSQRARGGMVKLSIHSRFGNAVAMQKISQTFKALWLSSFVTIKLPLVQPQQQQQPSVSPAQSCTYPQPHALPSMLAQQLSTPLLSRP